MGRPWTTAASRRAWKGERGGLDVATHARIKTALSDTYNLFGPDLGWVNQLPDDDEFVSVLCDLVGNLDEDYALSPEDLAAFRALPPADKRRLCLQVQ